ncbi:MAG TPA: hypothetical protein VK420_07445 [Longimicrobium sp.]|nr:hypothetical protein [Longimicrobium sp.]
MRVEIAMLRTPDRHSQIELSRFLAPPVIADHHNAPVNALGYLRVMFAIEDIDDTLARLRKHGAEMFCAPGARRLSAGSVPGGAIRAGRGMDPLIRTAPLPKEQIRCK